MANGSSNLSAIRAPGILDWFMYPADAIPEGYVCVFDTTADPRSVVLPGNAAQLNGGKAFAGISMDQGTSVVNVDNQLTVQKLGIAACALKINTACVKGQTAAYDPADGGVIVPRTSPKHIPIGVFQQSYSASAYVQLVGVELHAQSVGGSGLVGDVIVSSTAITGNTEQAFDQKVTVPAATLVAGSVLKVTGKVRQTAVNGTDTIICRIRFGGLAGVVMGVTPTLAGAVGGLSSFELTGTVRSAVAMTASGFAGTVASVQSTGSVGTLTIDTTVANDVVATVIFSSSSAGNTAVLEDLTVSVLGPVA